MNPQAAPSLRVCIEVEEGCYVAQCVDYDISGTGDTPESAVDDFINMLMKNMLVALRVGAEPLENIPPAPMEYVERWRRNAQQGRSVFTRRIPDLKVQQHGEELVLNYFGAIEASIATDAAA